MMKLISPPSFGRVPSRGRRRHVRPIARSPRWRQPPWAPPRLVRYLHRVEQGQRDQQRAAEAAIEVSQFHAPQLEDVSVGIHPGVESGDEVRARSGHAASFRWSSPTSLPDWFRLGRAARACRRTAAPPPDGLQCSASHGKSGSSGEVAEWSKAHAWKVCRRETVSRVRIPVSPPPR